LQEASIRYYGHYNDWPVIRPELSNEEIQQLAEHKAYDIRLNEWSNLSELRQAIAEAEDSNLSNVKFYRIDYPKLLPYVRIRSNLNHFVFRNPAGEVFIIYPAMRLSYSLTPEEPGEGASGETEVGDDDITSSGPLRAPEPGEIEIWTAEQLASIGVDQSYPLNARYIQMADIDLSGYSADGGWDPIGSESTPFTGAFDGNGFITKNLYIDRPSEDYQGLFGYAESAELSNITLTGALITGQDNTGALAGYINTTTIDSCVSTGTVTGRVNTGGLVGYNHWESVIKYSSSRCAVSGQNHVGGLVGYNHYRSSVIFSHAMGDVTGSGYYAGGLVGYNLTYSKIISSYAVGTVTGNNFVGGLVGLDSAGNDIISCYAAGKVTGNDYVGGLAGSCSGNFLISSYATGEVSGRDYVGGLAGRNSIKNTFKDCYATGKVMGRDNVGGLVGLHYTPTSAPITTSYAAGDVTGRNNVGGLVGWNTDGGNVTSCYATGKVTGSDYVGGLVGYNESHRGITNCYSIGEVVNNGSYNSYVGGLVGRSVAAPVSNSYWNINTSGLTTSGGGTGRTMYEMKQQSTFVGWDFDTVWQIQEGETYPYLRSNPQSPLPKAPAIEIRTAEQLAKIGVDPLYPLDGHYIQMADIDLSVYSTGEGWVPIGSSSEPFTGIFNGNGFMIKNLYINRPSNNQGLFGYVNWAGLRNITLKDVSVTGRNNTGALVGYTENRTIIEGCVSSGTVTGHDYVGGLAGRIYRYSVTNDSSSFSTVTGNNGIGGLVGFNGFFSNIISCYTAGTVTGNNLYIGGLVGYNYYNSTVTTSYTTSTVTGNSHVGGLVGYNYYGSAITTSYATGDVTGNSHVGGLVGYNYGFDSSARSTITASYSTGRVTSDGSYIGGLVGRRDSYSTVSNSYWDIDTSGLMTSAGGTGKTTAEMKQQSTFVGWDFGTVWQIQENETYPYLRANPQSPPPM
jgi:hypothetical protein